MTTIIRKTLIATFIISAMSSLIIIFLKDLVWASGFFATAIWSMANFLLTSNILQIANLQKSKKQLYAVLLLKFPFLYLLGFLVLGFKIFPLTSILAGILPLVIISGVFKLCPKLV